jgi:hypothetical protein
MVSSETKTYFSEVAQALAGNPQALEAVRVRARRGDQDAILILRQRGPIDDESADFLRELGYDPDTRRVTWSHEARHWHREVSRTRSQFLAAYDRFLGGFRDLCRETEGTTVGGRHNLPRQRLTERAEKLWQREVENPLRDLQVAESGMFASGVQWQGWSEGRPDPRANEVDGRLWNLSDTELGRRFGWVNPQPSVTPASLPDA